MEELGCLVRGVGNCHVRLKSVVHILLDLGSLCIAVVARNAVFLVNGIITQCISLKPFEGCRQGRLRGQYLNRLFNLLGVVHEILVGKCYQKDCVKGLAVGGVGEDEDEVVVHCVSPFDAA